MPSSQTTATALSHIVSLEPIKPPGGDGVIVVIVCVTLALTLAGGFFGATMAIAEHDTERRRRLFAGTAVFSADFLAVALALRFVAAPDATLGYVPWALIGSVALITLIAAAGWLAAAASPRNDAGAARE